MMHEQCMLSDRAPVDSESNYYIYTWSDKLPDYSLKRPRVTDNRALVNRIPYYRKFPVESNSRFRTAVSCTVHEIWHWKHSMVVWANGIARLWSRECTATQ